MSIINTFRRGGGASDGVSPALLASKMSIAFVDENDDPIDYTDAELGGRPMILVPGDPPRIRVGAVAPFSQSGLTELREGTGGLRYMNGESLAQLYEVLEHEDAISGVLSVSGRDATYHFYTADGDFEIAALTSAVLGIHIIYVKGGAAGPHEGSFGGGISVSDDQLGGGGVPFDLPTNDLLMVMMHRFARGGVTYQVVLSTRIMPDPTPTPPMLSNLLITPADGDLGDTYALSFDLDGNPPPDVDIQWKLNKVAVGGATGAQFTPAGDGPVDVDVAATNTTSPGTASASAATALCGPRQPDPVGDGTFIFRSGATGAGTQTPILPAGYQLGDRLMAFALLQTNALIPAPAGFTKHSGEILRATGDSGDNVRCATFSIVLDAGHIAYADANGGALGTGGVAVAIILTDNSTWLFELARGGNTVIFDSVQFNRSPGQDANSIAVEDAPVATKPALAYSIVVTSAYNLRAKLSSIPGWLGRVTMTSPDSAAGRQGARAHLRRISSGPVPSGTISCGGGAADARITTFTVLVEE